MFGAGALLAVGAVACHAPSASAQSAARKLLAEDAILERIGFGSCLDQRLDMPIWSAVTAADPQLFLMMGDNVYGDVSSAAMTELKAAYARLASTTEFAAARQAMPFLATWDDHDYGSNDAAGEFPHKSASTALFHEFWGTRPSLPTGEGVCSSRIVGPEGRRVQIILLDTRSFRSSLKQRGQLERLANPTGGKFEPDDDPAKTMLGEAQWDWLAAELARPADLRLLVSSIQVLAETHGWERWGHLPGERERLFRLIRDTNAKGLVLLSGDRHRAGIYKRSDGLPYPLHEITSSSLNRPFPAPEPADPTRLGDMYGGANFGLAALDWQQRRIAFTLRNQLGIQIGQLHLGFADIGL